MYIKSTGGCIDGKIITQQMHCLKSIAVTWWYAVEEGVQAFFAFVNQSKYSQFSVMMQFESVGVDMTPVPTGGSNRIEKDHKHKL